jgi:hypothetical protein
MEVRMRTMHPGASGAAILIALVMLAAVFAAAFALQASTLSLRAERERASERALAQARDALIAYSSDHPINASVGPGYLPCPDVDNDGWAESTCGSLSGDSGQEQRLGRLPWKTLGLPDLRDGHGERLWYAVSTKYKGLLNCGASRACVDMTPQAALGTLTVRDASGTVIHDGTIGDPARAAAGGAVAVVFAPGAPIERHGRTQQRECLAGQCDAGEVCIASPPRRAAICDPANYLDASEGLRGGDEDNASFIDRSDSAGRALNRDGFVMGPVVVDGRVVVNDRLAVITYGDLVPRILQRVAREVSACMRFYASRPENASRYPWMAASCADTSSALAEVAGNIEGRVPDTPFDTTAAQGMLPRWWRAQARSPEALTELPTRDDACRIAVAPDDAGPARTILPASPADEAATAAPSWWTPWRAYVSVAVAPGFTPQAPPHPTCSAAQCIRLTTGDGTVVARAASAVVAVHRSPGACATPLMHCDVDGCRATFDAGDAIAWLP